MSKEIKKPYISADIYLNVYDITVKVILTESLPYTFNELLKEDDSIVSIDVGDAAAVYVPSNKNNKMWLLIDKEYVDINTLYHEIFHITSNCMAIRDIQFDPNNHEAFAYTQGYIGGEIHKFLGRNKVNIKE